jgi:hypothetical protein
LGQSGKNDNGRSLSIGLIVKGFPSDFDGWLSRNASRYPWAEIGFRGPGEAECLGAIELTAKTTVADVKRQVLTFIARVERLEKDIR